MQFEIYTDPGLTNVLSDLSWDSPLIASVPAGSLADNLYPDGLFNAAASDLSLSSDATLVKDTTWSAFGRDSVLVEPQSTGIVTVTTDTLMPVQPGQSYTAELSVKNSASIQKGFRLTLDAGAASAFDEETLDPGETVRLSVAVSAVEDLDPVSGDLGSSYGAVAVVTLTTLSAHTVSEIFNIDGLVVSRTGREGSLAKGPLIPSLFRGEPRKLWAKNVSTASLTNLYAFLDKRLRDFPVWLEVARDPAASGWMSARTRVVRLVLSPYNQRPNK